jgi:beta-lactamase superfamily II metal-dependent hydrolase
LQQGDDTVAHILPIEAVSSRTIDRQNAAYEVDFLPVGNGEKSGDGIAVRFGNLAGDRNEQFVIVIDGGTQESGQALVDHIRKHYQTDEVDLVVSTHPDADHASGLKVVLEQLEVNRLWLHRPWQHSADIRGRFASARLTTGGLKRFIRKSLTTARDLEELAQQKDIPIDEPFSDVSLPFQGLGIFVLGPSEDYYESLLPHFRCTPKAKEEPADALLARLIELAKEGVKRIFESWGFETLTDPEEDATSPENNSSVVLLLHIGDRVLLLTADAGIPALARAANHAEDLGINLPDADFVQIPHHGSRRNVGPTLLNRILGPKLPEGSPMKLTAFVSASKEGAPKHPAKKVTNAFQRRGAKVIGTLGDGILHHHNAPRRAGWHAATPIPFYDQVEE